MYPRKKLSTTGDSFVARLRRIVVGLGAPRHSGERKYALSECRRIAGSGSASTTVCLIVLLLLILFAGIPRNETRADLIVDVTPDPKPESVPDPIPARPDDMDLADADDTITFTDAMAALTPDISALMAEPDANSPVLDTVSPLHIIRPGVMNIGAATGIAGLQGERRRLLAQRKAEESETSVIRALRWLKEQQRRDGSWAGSGSSTAMTSLALLCFMAHAETPASAEFGNTVERGLQHLLSAQRVDGRFRNAGPHYAYGHALATYALAESYGMTRIVMLREPIIKAAGVIIDGQQPGGAWDYDYKKGLRQDLSVTSWQVQALKACSLSGLDVEGIDTALEGSVLGIKSFENGGGRFSYTGSGSSPTLTGAAVLCLQFLGLDSDPLVSDGMQAISDLGCSWGGKQHNNTYSWYYATQAKFRRGGPAWDKWNRQMRTMLAANQHEDGHWSQGGAHGASDVYDTCLCCLNLEVYYRNLRTFDPSKDRPGNSRMPDASDIHVDVDLIL